MILESGIVTGTTADLMSSGRLNSIPYNGSLTMQFLADLGDASNHYDLSVQKPNGDVPVDTQQVPANAWGVDGLLDDRQLLQMTFQATQGGHFTVTLTETGTAVCAYRFILKP